MKYFTPELIARGQVEDHDLLDRHEEEWDQVCERYEAYLKTVLSHMPPGLKHIEESYYLHDATVLSISRRGTAFALVLQLDTPPRSILTFIYDLLSEPIIQEGARPAQVRMECDPPLWQYNVGKDVLVYDRTPGSQARGERIGADRLAGLADTDNWKHQMIFLMTWCDSDEEWLLHETEAMVAS